jgi:DNA mismatch repair protein MutS
VVSAGILGITLTKRNNAQVRPDGHGRFPHHALDTYLPKLIRAGRRVAICDQLEDPKKKREAIKARRGLTEMDKMVKRGITELVTPGVAMSDNVLNYKGKQLPGRRTLRSKTCLRHQLLDISTGEFLTGQGTYDYVEKLLGNFSPKEVLYSTTAKPTLSALRTPTVSSNSTTGIYRAVGAPETAQAFRHQIAQGLWRGAPQGRASSPPEPSCSTWSSPSIPTWPHHRPHPSGGGKVCAPRQVYHPLTRTPAAHAGGRGSLSAVDVIDRTVTPMGVPHAAPLARLSAQRRGADTRAPGTVEYFFREPEFRQLVDEQLHRVGDLERIVSRVCRRPRVAPRGGAATAGPRRPP